MPRNMYNSKNFFTSKGRQQRRRVRTRRAQDGVQYVTGPYSYNSQIGPYIAPQMPREFSVALNRFISVPFTSVTGLESQYFGLVEYLNISPDYLSTFYNLYKYSRVTAVKIECNFVNLTSSSSINIGMGIIPFNESPSMTDVLATRNSVFRTVSSMGGQDRVHFQKVYPVDLWIGNVPTSKYWVSGGQAASTSPIDSTEPIIMVAIQPSSAVTYTAELSVKLTYHVQFFDLITT